jgi:hypothetical protein
MTIEIIQQITHLLQADSEQKEVIQLLSANITTISPYQLITWLDSIIEKSHPYRKTIYLIEQHLISQIDMIDHSVIYPFVEHADYTRSGMGMRLLGAKKAYDDILRYINTPATRAKDRAIQVLLETTPHLVTTEIIETNLYELSPNELALWLKYAYQNQIPLSDTHLSKIIAHFSEQAEGEYYLELLQEVIDLLSIQMDDKDVMRHFYGSDKMLTEMSSWILATKFERGDSTHLIPELKNLLNDNQYKQYAETALRDITL